MRTQLQESFPNAGGDYLLAYAEEEAIHRVALRVLEARTAAGLTQEELARTMGKSQSWVAEIEGGYRNITLRSLARLAFALDRDLSEFLKARAGESLGAALKTEVVDSR